MEEMKTKIINPKQGNRKVEMKRPYLFKCHNSKCESWGVVLTYEKTLKELGKFSPKCKKCRGRLVRVYSFATVTNDGFKGI